tara:strand:- start:826 stop:945 length:120 start_codon:yes stop_codon:yes gene_type:complete
MDVVKKENERERERERMRERERRERGWMESAVRVLKTFN